MMLVYIGTYPYCTALVLEQSNLGLQCLKSILTPFMKLLFGLYMTVMELL